MQPLFDQGAIVFDDSLLGTWQSEDDETQLRVSRDQWRSYRIEYVHPIETGVLTGYLTSVGGRLYMNVMPGRGQAYGAFVVPMHATVRVTVGEDRLELTPLAYDAFLDAARSKGVPGLAFVIDQKQNVVVSSSTADLRRWLGSQGNASRWLGPTTGFRRVPPAAALESSPAMPHN
jgi:hypothetical protein